MNAIPGHLCVTLRKSPSVIGQWCLSPNDGFVTKCLLFSVMTVVLITYRWLFWYQGGPKEHQSLDVGFSRGSIRKANSEMWCCWDWNNSLGQLSLGRPSWLWVVPESKTSRDNHALVGVFLPYLQHSRFSCVWLKRLDYTHEGACAVHGRASSSADLRYKALEKLSVEGESHLCKLRVCTFKEKLFC